MKTIIIKVSIIIFFLVITTSFADPIANTGGAVKALGISPEQLHQYDVQQEQNTASPLQSSTNQSENVTQAQEDAIAPSVQAPSSSNIKLNTKTAYGNILEQIEPVFGENLFQNSCRLPQLLSFNPEYRISVGDQISIQLWGAFTFNQILTVDTQGNIFIPDVGPVHIAGVANKNLNKLIYNALKAIFKKDVGSYANLLTSTPVQVYVTGFVNHPGLYSGVSSDSVLYYLCAAGGINPDQGSFRNIEVLRNGQLYRHIDLYNFLLNGRLHQFQMHQGDTIVVKPIMNTIKVFGQVDNQYQFEFTQPTVSMKKLEKLAGLKPNVTYVRIQKNSGSVPVVSYLPIKLAQNYKLSNGDVVTFVSDQHPNKLLVTIDGQIFGPHEYVLKRGTTLAQLMKKVKYTHQASVQNTQLFRPSVAIEQKQAILTSLNSLQQRIVTATAATAQGAKIQASQANLLLKFISHAKNVQPKGQVVLTGHQAWKTVVLENNDLINVPEKTNVITISGQVMTPISVTLNPNFTVNDYIRAAGGFSTTANKSRVLILHQNGAVQVVSGNVLFGIHNVRIYGGDQIIVPPKPYTQNLQISTAITQILYQVAIATKVALDL